MKKLFNLLTLLVLMSACQKTAVNTFSEHTHFISSAFTTHDYALSISVPSDFQNNRSYPVVYLVDGHYHYEDVKQIFVQMDILKDVILVGIAYKDYPYSLSNDGMIQELRGMDFTYPAHETADGRVSGGGALLFAEFFQQELIPFMEQNYSADTSSQSRTLMGHSSGGYFCMFQLFHFREAPIFNNVVALTPALWWSDAEILEMEQQANLQNDALPYNLYLGYGKQDFLKSSVLIEELNEQLNQNQYNGLNHRMETHNGGHFSSANPGFIAGLKFIFQ